MQLFIVKSETKYQQLILLCILNEKKHDLHN